MQTINLYRYIRPDGGVTVSPIEPDVEYTVLYRLVADEGYILTNDTTYAPCIDTNTPGEWSEVIDNSVNSNNYEEELVDSESLYEK